MRKLKFSVRAELMETQDQHGKGRGGKACRILDGINGMLDGFRTRQKLGAIT